MAFTVFRRYDVARGKRYQLPRDAFVELLRRERRAADKRQLPLVSLATFRDDYRDGAHIERVYAIGYDVDVDGTSLDSLAGALAACAGIVHTTHSHAPHAPRLRAFVWVSRPVDAIEYRRIHGHGERLLREVGIRVGTQAKDPTRQWYVPGAPRGAELVVRELPGRPIDVDQTLTVVEPAPTQRAKTPSACGAPYVDAAIRSAVDHVAGAGEGTRNDTLNAETFSLARFVVAGAISERAVVEAMLYAARVAGLGEHEASRTIASALRGRRSQ